MYTSPIDPMDIGIQIRDSSYLDERSPSLHEPTYLFA